ncbi:MAG: ABC transporter ATP-binding protein [Candidatus Babeliales bacterium]
MNKLIQVRSLEKKYGQLLALKKVNLDLFAGEIVSLLGVNGAGKTTLSSVIATIHPPSAGDILFNGASIFHDIPAYRMHIGYCAQKNNLNPLLTNKENMVNAGRYYGMDSAAIATRIDYLDSRLGIGQFLYQSPDSLSGGWKQRYMIARTLMHAPQFIILDEPTVALDPDVRHLLWQYIKDIRADGVTVLLTTHYLDEAEILSDRVCVLHQGEIKMIDTPQNLIKNFQKGKLEEVFLHLTREFEGKK